MVREIRTLIAKYKEKQIEYHALYEEANGIAKANFACGNHNNGEYWGNIASQWFIKESIYIAVIFDLNILVSKFPEDV